MNSAGNITPITHAPSYRENQNRKHSSWSRPVGEGRGSFFAETEGEIPVSKHFRQRHDKKSGFEDPALCQSIGEFFTAEKVTGSMSRFMDRSRVRLGNHPGIDGMELERDVLLESCREAFKIIFVMRGYLSHLRKLDNFRRICSQIEALSQRGEFFRLLDEEERAGR